ncbi:MAG TPA: hypothetical protein VN888_01755 [Mycobacterium sp.]|nr:hypothetical protein [Mycobacterium sp.]
MTVAVVGSYGDDRAPGGDVSLGTVDIHVRRPRAKLGLHARVPTTIPDHHPRPRLPLRSRRGCAVSGVGARGA